MTDAEFQAELDKREVDKKSASQTADSSQQLDKAKREVVAAVIATTKANMQHRENTTTKVDVQNDIAGTQDVNRAVEAINNLAVLMLSQGQQKPSVNMIDGTDLGDRFSELGKTLTDLLTEVRNDTKQDENMQTVTKQLDTFLKQLKSLQVAPDPDVKKSLANVEKALSKLDVKPTVNVPAPKVTVAGKDVDLSPLVTLLDKISTTLDSLPKEQNDDSEVIAGLGAVQNAITSLRFPVANYMLPFKDVNGKDVQVALDSNGNLPVNSDGTLPTTVVAGQQAVTASAVALPSATLTQGVIITGLSTNSISVFIGGAGVSDSTGAELQPGAALSIVVSNLNDLYVVASTTGATVTWIGS